MSRADLRSLLFHIAAPFATGAALGSIFMCSIYLLDIGGMRSMLAASGGSIFDLGLIPVACAFGSLAIGTMEFLVDN